MPKRIAIAAALLLAATPTGCSVNIGTTASATASASPVPVFTVRAHLGFSGAHNIQQGRGAANCRGVGKFATVTDGAAVAVFDSSGIQVGTGTVRDTEGERVVDNLSLPVTSCGIRVVINGVPAGSPYYDLQVGCTAPVRVAGADLMAEEVNGVITSGCP